MFPTLRLILSASVATLVLVALVGSGMVLFMPPPARLTDASGTVRPVTSLIDDGRTGAHLDAGARRMAELERLLSLPSGPARAYAAEPPAVFPYEIKAARPEQADISIPSTSQPPAIEVTVPAEPDVATDHVPPPPSIVAALPQAADPTPPSPSVDEPAVDRPVAEEPVAVAPDLDAAPVSVETIATIDEDSVPLPKPKVLPADPSAITAVAKAKPQTASRPRAKAKKLRFAAQRRARKSLPEATEFEERQGQFFNFGYGNSWDNRAGWSTQVGAGQRPANTSRPAE
jgi:hypothetical protein